MKIQIKQILEKYNNKICFIVGNGINRVSQNNASWEELLTSLWKKITGNKIEIPNEGISLTEFYDLIELNNIKEQKPLKLQKEFCNQMKKWKPSEQHKNFINFAKKNNIPVLTTNFDNLLKEAGNLSFYRTSKK